MGLYGPKAQDDERASGLAKRSLSYHRLTNRSRNPSPPSARRRRRRRRRRSHLAIMLGLPPSFDSNGSKKTTLKSFTSGASSGPLNPRVSYLLKHLNSEKINDIMNRMNRGEITGEEMIKLLEKESNSCLEGMKQEERMEEEVMEDEDEEEEEEEGRKKIEEDGEMGMTLRLGDQEKPGVVKRPQSSLVACEVESKKPRVTQALGFQGGEPVPAEM